MSPPMIILILLGLLQTSRVAVQSKGKDVKVEEKVYDKSNPIRSISFENRDETQYALIILSRSAERNNVNLMRSSKPDDPNSYIISRDLSDDIKQLPGLKWRISLANADINDQKLVFSIQIREGPNIHQTEPFYYDKGEGKFKLLREKTEKPLYDTDTIIYISLAAVGAIIVLIGGYVLFFRK